MKKQSQTNKKYKFLWKIVHMASSMATVKGGAMTCKLSTGGNCHISHDLSMLYTRRAPWWGWRVPPLLARPQ